MTVPYQQMGRRENSQLLSGSGPSGSASTHGRFLGIAMLIRMLKSRILELFGRACPSNRTAALLGVWKYAVDGNCRRSFNLLQLQTACLEFASRHIHRDSILWGQLPGLPEDVANGCLEAVLDRSQSAGDCLSGACRFQKPLSNTGDPMAVRPECSQPPFLTSMLA